MKIMQHKADGQINMLDSLDITQIRDKYSAGMYALQTEPLKMDGARNKILISYALDPPNESDRMHQLQLQFKKSSDVVVLKELIKPIFVEVSKIRARLERKRSDSPMGCITPSKEVSDMVTPLEVLPVIYEDCTHVGCRTRGKVSLDFCAILSAIKYLWSHGNKSPTQCTIPIGLQAECDQHLFPGIDESESSTLKFKNSFQRLTRHVHGINQLLDMDGVRWIKLNSTIHIPDKVWTNLKPSDFAARGRSSKKSDEYRRSRKMWERPLVEHKALNDFIELAYKEATEVKKQKSLTWPESHYYLATEKTE
ncbi:hypothetical protein PSTG_10445 [Puccinia striiformis f. sp. tritici PST-78]|uniref:Uncharacterized protein n=1 Tax=Puccinia striiformis f. sp. tritici PST-78 TaxID=1165861 RepID=A0A0L0VAN9_9BASI|nr:hypothetical protein PSTG_10445 [Puccinia striiformis f. sp. tritici PST-78]